MRLAILVLLAAVPTAQLADDSHFRAPQTEKECFTRNGTVRDWGDVEVCTFQRGNKQDVWLLKGGCNFDDKARNSPRCRCGK
jgi:hypothetical protein